MDSDRFLLFINRLFLGVGIPLILTGCFARPDPSEPPPSKRVFEYGQEIPKGGGVYKVGNPYKIRGEWFYPEEDPDYRAQGIASWYGPKFHGRYTANGEIFDMDSISAAHPTMPLPSYAQVTNLDNGRSVIVRVNDRGPYAHGRLIDLSRRAARLLDFHRHGTAPVEVVYMQPAPLSGEDGWALLAPDLGYQEGPIAVAAVKRVEEEQTEAFVEVAQETGGPIQRVSPVFSGQGGDELSSDSYVQVGSFRDPNNAHRLTLRLEEEGHHVQVTQVDLSGTTHYRVLVASAPDPDEMDVVLQVSSSD